MLWVELIHACWRNQTCSMVKKRDGEIGSTVMRACSGLYDPQLADSMLAAEVVAREAVRDWLRGVRCPSAMIVLQ